MVDTFEIYKVTFTDMKNMNKTFFPGWHCELGEHRVSIKVNGKVRYSTCKNKTQTCYQRLCWCAPDIEIPKAIDKNTLDIFKEKVKTEINYPRLDISKEHNIVAVGDMKQLLNTRFLIDWNILKRCNYDCSYCPPRIHDNHSPYPELESLKAILNDTDVPPNRDIDVTITGGEPTLYPDIFNFISWLKKDYGCKIMLLTNGTPNIEKLKKLHKECKLCISLHNEYVNEKFLDKLATFVESSEPYNEVDFRIFENDHYEDFINRVEKIKFVNVVKNNPIVNKDTSVWKNELTN